MAVEFDQLFPYSTQKMVNLLDRRLGLIYYGISLLVFCYIIFFVIIYKQGHLESEIAIGQVEMVIRGKTTFPWRNSKYVVDSVDMVDPAIEHNAVFITSRIEIVQQARSTCGNLDYECDTDADCPIYPPIAEGKCGTDGLCQELGWCPPLDSLLDKTNVHNWQFDHPENVTIWVKAAINFPKIAPHKTFTTMTDVKPIYMQDDPEHVNAYRLKDLLAAAKLDPSDRTILQKGCMLTVRMEWRCHVDTLQGCLSPIIEVQRLDVGAASGFHFFDAEYRKDEEGRVDKDTRFLMKQTGYRLLISSKGIGYRTSLSAIMLQLSSGLALLTLARTAADALMMYILPERSHYRRYKEEETPDFSDIRDLREARQKQETEMKVHTKK